MQILVTGGAGFIGSNITDKLIELGHDVIILDDLSTGKKENINPKATFYNIDIRTAEIEKIFQNHKIDIVYHLAAQIDVRKSVSNPQLDSAINVLGGINLLTMMQRYKVRKIVYSSTGGAIYGEPQYIPADENHPIRPMAPYGVSKHCLEHYIEYFHDIYGIDYTIFRYANVYGQRQDPLGEAGVIAIFAGRMAKGQTAVIFGNGKQTRDFVYVGDVVAANVLALEKGSKKIYNIGTGKETSVNEIYACLKKLMNITNDAKYEPERPGEVFRIALDVSKAEKELGWTAQVSLEEGLIKTLFQ